MVPQVFNFDPYPYANLRIQCSGTEEMPHMVSLCHAASPWEFFCLDILSPKKTRGEDIHWQNEGFLQLPKSRLRKILEVAWCGAVVSVFPPSCPFWDGKLSENFQHLSDENRPGLLCGPIDPHYGIVAPDFKGKHSTPNGSKPLLPPSDQGWIQTESQHHDLQISCRICFHMI